MPRFHSTESSVDKGWAWMILSGAVLWNFSVSGTLKSFGVLYVEFVELFHSTPTETSWIAFVFNFMMLIFSPFSGYLADHFVTRWILILGSIVAATGVFLTGFAQSVTHVIISYGVIAGGAVGVMDGPVFGTLNNYFSKKRGFANSFSFVGSGIGCLVLPIILRICVDTYTIRGTMFVLAGLWLQPCIIGALFRPIKLKSNNESIVIANNPDVSIEVESKCTNNKEKKNANCYEKDLNCSSSESSKQDCCIKRKNDVKETHHQINDIQESTDKDSQTLKSVKNNIVIRTLQDYLKFLDNPPMLRVVFAIMFGSFAYFNQMFLFPSMVKELDLPAMQGAVLVSVTGIAEVCSRIPLGYISDKPYINKQLLVALFSLLCFGVAFIVSFVPQRVVLNIYSGVLGLIGGTTVPMAMPILVQFVSSDRIGSVAGLFLWAMSVAFALGPPILGAIQMRTGSYFHSYRVCISMYIPAAILLIWNVVSCHLAEKQRKILEVNNKENVNCCEGQQVKDISNTGEGLDLRL